MNWLLKYLVAQATKRGDWLLSQGYPEFIVNVVEKLDKTAESKFIVWIAKVIRDSLAEQLGVKSSNKIFRKNDPKTLSVMVERIAAHIQRDVLDIIDWAVAESPDIMKFNFENAKKEADRWHGEMKVNEDSSLATKYQSIPVHDFGDGWKIVKLTPQDCEIEGELMGHCVEGYANQVANGRTEIYSLRDPKNMPHATIEMATIETYTGRRWQDEDLYQVAQIQGKENNPPIDKYANYIKQWLDIVKQKMPVEWAGGYDPYNESANDMAIDEYRYTGSMNDRYGLQNPPFIEIQDVDDLMKMVFDEAVTQNDRLQYGWTGVTYGAVNLAAEYELSGSREITLEKLENEANESLNTIYESAEGYVDDPYPDEEDFVDENGEYDYDAYEEAVDKYQQLEDESIDQQVQESGKARVVNEIMNGISKVRRDLADKFKELQESQA